MCRREDVLNFISTHPVPFTTADVSENIQTKEYSARAAVSWLRLGGYIEFVGWHQTRTHVRLYKWTGKIDEIEVCHRDRDQRQVAESERSTRRVGKTLQDLINEWAKAA